MNGLAFDGAHPAGGWPPERRGSFTRQAGRAQAEADTSAVASVTFDPAPAGSFCGADSGSSDVAISDWDELFSAVEARLTATVGELFAVLPETSASVSANRIRISVLECVAALHQLHSTVTHELARRQRTVLELTETRTALAQARAEISGLLSLR